MDLAELETELEAAKAANDTETITTLKRAIAVLVSNGGGVETAVAAPAPEFASETIEG